MPTITYDHQIFALQQFGGISRYFCELASRVNRTTEFDAKVVAPVHFNDYLSHCQVPTVGMHLPMSLPRTGRLYRAACRVLSPVLMLASRPSVVHRTYYSRTFAPASAATVVTVFDMIHEIFPEHFPVGDATSRNKRASVLSADLVLCISESTAADVVRIFNVPREKIRVTYLGFSDSFSDHNSQSDRPHTRPYLLYVGHRAGYKNFQAALQAYANSRRLREAFDFVVFGGFAIDAKERGLFKSLGLRGDAVRRLTGSDQALSSAYRHAHAFVYPSTYEGFGIPPLEAMASGCPVACSNASSIPEIVGAAAELFDPAAPDSIQQALERICFDDTRRAALVESGHQRITKFSWDRCAAETVNAYRELLDVVPS